MKKCIKVGIAIPYLYSSQLAYETVRTVNGVWGSEYDCTIFMQDVAPPVISPMCATMAINELWTFSGTLITTNLQNTLYGINAITNKKHVFYVYDLEWIRKSKNYLQNIKIYSNPSIKLATRSKYYADAIENYCNVRPEVLPFNVKELVNYAQ